MEAHGDAQYFTKLKAYYGYRQMKSRKKERPKTAFCYHAEVFQCILMPLRLTTPAGFQRALEIVRKMYKWKTWLVFLDDVIIFSNNVEDDFRHADEILTILHEAGVNMKINKWHFFQRQVE